MANSNAQNLSRMKKFLLASAGVAALAGAVVIGVDHSPSVHAQLTATPVFEAASIKPQPVRQSWRRTQSFSNPDQDR